MPAKANFHDRALARIIRIGAALGIIGTVVMWIRFGTKTAVGFLAGSLLSLLNFHGLRRVVDGLSGNSKPGMRATPVFWAFRYILFAGIGYVIVKGLGINLMPILAGLFVAAAAIILEILYEITYART
jgi:ATP synthase I chain